MTVDPALVTPAVFGIGFLLLAAWAVARRLVRAVRAWARRPKLRAVPSPVRPCEHRYELRCTRCGRAG